MLLSGKHILFPMSSSCSFRITRTAEDLALTINSLSQRLVKLEQRLEALEKNSIVETSQQSLEEMKMLDGVDQVLRECQELLDTSDSIEERDKNWPADIDQEDIAA